MEKPHHVIPIPAYDMHGHLIYLAFYCNHLLSVVVEMHFELTCWSIHSKDDLPASDTYVTDVVALHVLVPPKTQCVSPRKCKVYHHVDPLELPTKKIRFDFYSLLPSIESHCQ